MGPMEGGLLMEDFVRRLFTDGDFRQAFLANPAEVIANGGLTRTERDAAQRLSGHLAAAVAAPRGGVLNLEGLLWN